MPNRGARGITLGGGVGFLVRKHGLTIDSLLAAELVTADGQFLRVDAENHPDLFWAIRGGGGNFGVATRFLLRLHEVGTVVGGSLYLPATPQVIASFIAEAEAAPEELSTIANVVTLPPVPFIPEELHGKLGSGPCSSTPARSRRGSGPSRRSGRWRRPSLTRSGRSVPGTGPPALINLWVEGGVGRDRLVGTNLQDYFDGGKGTDTVIAEGGKDWVDGSNGGDKLKGGGSRDKLFGGPGADTLNGGQGVDFCSDGKGRGIVRSCVE
jgi:hypothetical protein